MVVSRQISTSGVAYRLDVAHVQARARLCETTLTDNAPTDDESHQLYTRSSATSAPVAQQTIAFSDLSPEMRNLIYSYAFSHDDALTVATPFLDEIMILAVQPAITRVSRQVRAESLAMFYAESTFVAYVRDWNFQDLFCWIRCVTRNPDPPKVNVHVKLLDLVKCEYQLLPLVRAWQDLSHRSVHLTIHNCFDGRSRHRLMHPAFDQRVLVTEAIRLAEELKAEEDFGELRLREACSKLVLEVARFLPDCDAISTKRAWCLRHNFRADGGERGPL